MDTNLVLLWMVGASSVFGVAQAVRLARSGQPDWLIAYGLVLAASFLGWKCFPAASGTISLVAFALLIVAPMSLQRRVMQFSNAQDYERAERAARWVARLHPAGVYPAQVAMVSALGLAKRGENEQAERALEALVQTGHPALRSSAAVHLYRLRGQWAEYLELTQNASSAELAANPAILSGRLRALAELGRADELLAYYTEHQQQLSAAELVMVRLTAQLLVAVVCGRVQLARRLAGHRTFALSPDARDYWVGCAFYAAGDAASGQRILERVAREADRMTSDAAKRKLASPPSAAEISAQAAEALDDIERELQHEEAYGAPQARPARPYVTYALTGLNLAMFGLEAALGDPESGQVLYEAGALIRDPDVPLRLHDSWRLVSALFVHVGWLHLSMNLLGLWVLGAFVERRLGRFPTLVVYLTSGLVGSLCVAYLPASEPMLFAGASGCIMGWLGALAAILIDGHLRVQARAASQRLWRIGVTMLMQVMFDLTVPHISMLAHWTGVATGLVVGYLFVLRSHKSTGTEAVTRA